MRHLCDDAWNERYAEQVQLMGYTVVGQSLDNGIAGYNLSIALCGGVSAVGCRDVCCERLPYLWQFLHQSCGNLLGSLPSFRGIPGLTVVFFSEAQSGQYLLGKQFVELLHVDAYLVFYCTEIY